ncbi:hypothetical protein JCM11491_002767 [Sporobolomyces phaffii]
MTTETVLAASRALYRSLLRTATRMPDDHRRALVVFRARSEFDSSKTLTRLEDITARQTEGEIYRDQLEFQARHLQALARSSNLLIPVDIRSSSRPSPAAPLNRPSRPPRPVRPTRPPPPSLHGPSSHSPPSELRDSTLPSPRPIDRRKLVRAIQSRKQGAVRGRSGQNRFMQGPEPSWIVRKRQQQALGDDRDPAEAQAATAQRDAARHDRHGPGCGC